MAAEDPTLIEWIRGIRVAYSYGTSPLHDIINKVWQGRFICIERFTDKVILKCSCYDPKNVKGMRG